MRHVNAEMPNYNSSKPNVVQQVSSDRVIITNRDQERSALSSFVKCTFGHETKSLAVCPIQAKNCLHARTLIADIFYHHVS